jgi:hypothetical protein
VDNVVVTDVTGGAQAAALIGASGGLHLSVCMELELQTSENHAGAPDISAGILPYKSMDGIQRVLSRALHLATWWSSRSVQLVG